MVAEPSDPRALELGRSLIERLPTGPAGVARSVARRVLGRTPPPPSTRIVVPDAGFVEVTDPDSDHAVCPMCGTSADAFLPYGVKASKPDRRCPGCNSLERHRLAWLYFALRTDLIGGRGSADRAEQISMLHIAPERPMEDRLTQLGHIDYLTDDLEPGKAMVVMDVTAIDRPDRSFDVIYASHVLEHVPDDVRAMSELCRVLKPDGWAILEVPIFGDTTREDPTVTDPRRREELFGQRDHVRMYGNDGEYERRLRKAGFEVDVVDLATELGPAAARRFRLRPGEDLHVCRKAG